MTWRIRYAWRRFKMRREALRTVLVVHGPWPAGTVIRNVRTGENMMVGPVWDRPAPRYDAAENTTTLFVTRAIGSVCATRMVRGDWIAKVADPGRSGAEIVVMPPPTNRLESIVLREPTRGASR